MKLTVGEIYVHVNHGLNEILNILELTEIRYLRTISTDIGIFVKGKNDKA